jgi:lysophospholipase L1-like esterase
MVVTLLGDSLTAGNLGIPYSRYLNLPADFRVVNRGRDGDTVLGILSRLDDALRSDGADVAVVQVGANDVLLPEMRARGGAWKDFVDLIIGAGSMPTPDPQVFSELYADLLQRISAWGTYRIVCVTVPPAGENLDSERNRKRGEINRRIRAAAGNNGALIADVAAVFEKELGNLQIPSDWFFENPEQFITDTRILRKEKSARRLSESRGLYLTMDGAHLNEQGAGIAGRLIGEMIQFSR